MTGILIAGGVVVGSFRERERGERNESGVCVFSLENEIKYLEMVFIVEL